MVEVARRVDAETIDTYLFSLVIAWSALPEVFRDFPKMHPEDRQEFFAEWPTNTLMEERVQQWASQKMLTPEQQEQWSKIQVLIEKYLPLQRELFSR